MKLMTDPLRLYVLETLLFAVCAWLLYEFWKYCRGRQKP